MEIPNHLPTTTAAANYQTPAPRTSTNSALWDIEMEENDAQVENYEVEVEFGGLGDHNYFETYTLPEQPQLELVPSTVQEILTEAPQASAAPSAEPAPPTAQDILIEQSQASAAPSAEPAPPTAQERREMLPGRSPVAPVRRSRPRRNRDNNLPGWAYDIEERRIAAEERRNALEERRIALEERRITLEETLGGAILGSLQQIVELLQTRSQ